MKYAVADILAFITSHIGEDLQSYSKDLANKRIVERAAQLSMTDLKAYSGFLYNDPNEPAVLARMLRIRFSRFFRDPLQFEILGSIIIPSMLRDCTSGLFRIWSAACASGEEPYSLAIIIDEALQNIDVKARVQIFATDIAEDALDEARLGRYLPGSLGDATLQRITNYFTSEKSGYQIIGKIRDMVTYSRHDLLDQRIYVPQESIFGGFDLVLCRNFLMYLDAEASSRVFDNLFKALNPEGVILLGNAEVIPARYEAYLERVVPCGNLFRKTTKQRRG